MREEPSAATCAPGSLAAYVRATRPHFLAAAAAPALLGVAAAAAEGAAVGLPSAMASVAGAMLANAAANVINDVHDAEGDAANEGRLFPFTGGSRVLQQGLLPPAAMRRLAAGLLLATCLLGMPLALLAGPGLLATGGAGLLLAWAYSAPPLALASRGLGEAAVAGAYGLLIPLGSAQVQLGRLSPTAAVLGVPSAALVTNLLVVNEFPDAAADARVGKRTLVVRLGTHAARYVYAGLTCTAVAWHAWAGLPLAAAPPLALSVAAAAVVVRHGASPSRALEPGIQLSIAAAISYNLLLACVTYWNSGAPL